MPLTTAHTRCSSATAWLLPAVLALTWAPHVAAEDLVQVYELAYARDATLLAAQALLRSAAPRTAQADALRLPSVSAESSRTHARTDPSPSEADPQGTRVGSSTSALSLNFRQPLFNRAASTDIAKARTELEIAGTEFEAVQQEFVVRVAQAYFDVLAAQDVLAATRASKASVAGQLDAATRHYNAGTTVITDVRDSQARYDLVVAQELSAANNLRVHRLALDRLTGRADLIPQALALPVMLPAIAPPAVQTWLDAAARHPAVRRARLVLHSAQLDTERAKAARLPTVDAVGTVELSRLSSAGAGVDVASRSRTASIGVALTVPLFAGFATQNRIAETLLLEDKAREDLTAAERSVAASTEQAYYDLQTGLAQVTALEAAEVSNKLSLEGTQLGYRAGVRVNLDVLNAQAQLFQTLRDLAKARYDALMGSLKLSAAAGQLKASDLAAINGLLTR